MENPAIVQSNYLEDASNLNAACTRVTYVEHANTVTKYTLGDNTYDLSGIGKDGPITVYRNVNPDQQALSNSNSNEHVSRPVPVSEITKFSSDMFESKTDVLQFMNNMATNFRDSGNAPLHQMGQVVNAYKAKFANNAYSLDDTVTFLNKVVEKQPTLTADLTKLYNEHVSNKMPLEIYHDVVRDTNSQHLGQTR